MTQQRTMCRIVTGCAVLFAALCARQTASAQPPKADRLQQAVTFYASFDEQVRGDVGGGDLSPQTRFDNPRQKGQYIYEKGYRKEAFRIDPTGGVHGGALQGTDVLPHRGRMFFPAQGNLPFNAKGWSGSVSMWLNTNPDTMLKTKYCDPIQITERRAGDGGLWIDFPNVKPRDLRLGAFKTLTRGEKSVPEKDPQAPLIHVKNVGFEAGDWHHLVMTWSNFDSDQKNATATLYIDGRKMGQLTDRDIAMRWNLDKTGIYVAVAYIGLLDELALFNRVLTTEEIERLRKQPGLLATLKQQTPKSSSRPRNVSQVIERGKLPYRVHVVEDYETDIEKKWWLRGKLGSKDVPPSLSSSIANHRASRATATLTFDRKMGDRTRKLKGVVFNPVPGPPMGKNTRLSFRYKLKGTDRVQVQIYSLTNNYHRYLMLTDLPQNRWRSATVDMTAARRPDGSGGPLAEDERIDDIQFYIDPAAELLIDDILLYDAATTNEKRPFPRRVIFTAWFDTGKQGAEWPGDFKIVLHRKPLTWDAAKSVIDPESGKPHLRIHMRGRRQLSDHTRLRFRYHLKDADRIDVALVHSDGTLNLPATVTEIRSEKWAETSVDFRLPLSGKKSIAQADEIHFRIADGATLLVDDLLLYEPGDPAEGG